MNTQNTFGKTFRIVSDEQLIRENSLAINSKKFVEEFVTNLNKAKEIARVQSPQEFKYMSDWAEQFNDNYNLTNKVNPVTPLCYLIHYCKEKNSGGEDLMVQMVFLPKKFQMIFGRHFVSLR